MDRLYCVRCLSCFAWTAAVAIIDGKSVCANHANMILFNGTVNPAQFQPPGGTE